MTKTILLIDDDAPQQAIRLGVTEFVLRPFNVEKFISTIERQLETRHLEHQEKPSIHEEKMARANSSIGKWKFPEEKFFFEKQILLKQTNIMGNTYYDNYSTWQGEARERLPPRHPAIGEWLEDNKHVKMVTYSIYYRFLSETTFGDVVRIQATAREIKKCSFIMVFRFFNTRTSAVLGEGGGICTIPQIILDLIKPIKENEVTPVNQGSPL